MHIMMSLDCVRKLTEPKLNSSGTVETSHTRKCSVETGTSYGKPLLNIIPIVGLIWYNDTAITDLCLFDSGNMRTEISC